MQLNLLSPPVPPTIPDIDLRCCDVGALLADVSGARLIVADPPWHYTNAPGHSADPQQHYAVMDDARIGALLAAAYDSAAAGARLALWTTWPKLDAWWSVVADLRGAGRWRWRYVSGGAWTKVRNSGGAVANGGVGYHWRGRSEPVLVYVKGSPGCSRFDALANAHLSVPRQHSEKPAGWMSAWLDRWTDPGDLVVDLFAGMAPLARSCLATGRRYVGAEIDPVRHRAALDRLALWRTKEVR